jgi:tRNA dimethylallyltransferase
LSLGGQVISVDSMQVYRGMDIGTAKPTFEERRGVVHHMIDVAAPEEDFTVAEFRRLGREVMESAEGPLVVCGGSGLHFRALVDPMTFPPSDPDLRSSLEIEEPERLAARLVEADPDAALHVDLANPRRVGRALEILELTGATPSQRAATGEAGEFQAYVPEIEFTAFGVDPGTSLDDRIPSRLASMIERGLVEEVRELWPRMGRTARGAVGYREMASHLEGGSTLEEAVEATVRATRGLARRQRTWFQRDPRIKWIAWTEDPSEMNERVMEALQ